MTRDLNIRLRIILFISGLLTTLSSYSQTAPVDSMEGYNKAAGAAVFLLIAFLFIMILVLTSPKYEHYDENRKLKPSLFSRIWQALNKGVPVENEKDIMLEHGFDGIHELNNRIPPWFNILFYGTIVFAAFYFVNYHVLGSGSVMLDEYVQEVKIANEKRDELIRTGAFINEDNVTVLTDKDMVEDGKKIYITNCSPCHGPDGGGTVGPNLTDKSWIHGGGMKNIFKTIKYGVPSKGMITWQTMMNPKQIQKVASYVLTLQGTTPAVGKAPEGTIWVEESLPSGDSLKRIDSLNVKDSLKVKK